ncbi:MAG: hypothetical protein IKD69_10365 [Solobacterium sp.]|nr:hypothetical protein [Solobacterium sp.]
MNIVWNVLANLQPVIDLLDLLAIILFVFAVFSDEKILENRGDILTTAGVFLAWILWNRYAYTIYTWLKGMIPILDGSPLYQWIWPLATIFFVWLLMQRKAYGSKRQMITMAAVICIFLWFFEIVSEGIGSIGISIAYDKMIMERVYDHLDDTFMYAVFESISLFGKAVKWTVMAVYLPKTKQFLADLMSIRSMNHAGMMAGLIFLYWVIAQADALTITELFGFETLNHMAYGIRWLIVMLVLLFLYLLKQKSEVMQLKNRDMILNRSLEECEKQVVDIQKQEQMVIENHVLAERLSTLQKLVEKGNQEELAAFLEVCRKPMDAENRQTVYSANSVVNAVLNYKQEHNPEFQFEVQSTIDNQCGILSYDLGIIVMHLIDQRLSKIRENQEEKKVVLHLNATEKMLIIDIPGALYDNNEEKETMNYAVVDNLIRKYHGHFSDADSHSEINEVILVKEDKKEKEKV